MTISVLGVPPGLVGVQQPRVSLVPDYASSSGDEAVELAALAGLHLDPWQQLVLRHSLGERPDGKWAAFQVGLVVSRQNGKGSCLEARELAELFLVARHAGPRTVVHSAHLFATSLEHFRRLKQRIEDTPELLRLVKHRGSKPVGIRESHGEESIELEDGSRILFAARTRGGRRGFTVDLLVWDEAMELPDAVIGAVMPTVSARTGPEFLPGPQVWYAGSAVNQQTMPYGHQLARIRELASVGAESALCYMEWSAPEDADPGDPHAWAQANPGLGIRIMAEYVATERAAMPPMEFGVERLGIGDWPSLDPESDRVITDAMWVPLADPSSRIKGAHMFAVDVDPSLSWATIAAAGLRGDGLFHVGVVEHARGTGWVVERCRGLLEAFPGSRVAIDPRSEIAGLVTDLENAGVQPVRMTAADYGEACAGFFQAVTEKRLRYMPPQPELDSAVAGARAKSMFQDTAWKWSRKDSSALITPVVAATNALWCCRTQGTPEVHSLREALERMQHADLDVDEPLIV